MHFLIHLVLLLLPTSMLSQIFVNKNGEQISENWEFNAAFIRERNIKSINGRFTFKRAGSPMRETNYWQIFEFDSLGRIFQTYETRKDDGTVDTIRTKYFYNDKGLLIYESVGTESYFSYTTTVFNDKKEVISIEEFKRYPDFYGNPITQEENSERYSYDVIDGLPTKTKLNNYGTAFARVTSFFDESGKLIKIEDRFINTNEVTTIAFSYDDNGNLIENSIFTSSQELKKEYQTFKYDEKGNLLEKKVFSGKNLQKETQFIYNETSNLPSAILIQDGGSSNITILRIKEYEYY